METVSEEIDRNSSLLAKVGTQRYEVTNRSSEEPNTYALITYTCVNVGTTLSWAMTITDAKGKTRAWSWRPEEPVHQTRVGKGWTMPGYATAEEALLFRVQAVGNDIRRLESELATARDRQRNLSALTMRLRVSNGR